MDLSALPTMPWPERKEGGRTCTRGGAVDGSERREGSRPEFGRMDLDVDQPSAKETWPLGNALRAQKRRREEKEFEEIDQELLRLLLNWKPRNSPVDAEDTEDCEFEGPPMPEGQKRLSSTKASLSRPMLRDCTQKSCTGLNSKRVSFAVESIPSPMELQVLVDKILTGYDTQEYTSPPRRPRGRIVLPRGTVESLELLDTDNDTCVLALLDCNDPSEDWSFRLKRWNNRRGNMYVLEGAGSYLFKYNLKSGDTVRILADVSKQLYLQHEKRTSVHG